MHDQRGSYFIEQEIFKKDLWAYEVNKALKEYFLVLSQRSNNSMEFGYTPSIIEYVNLWKKNIHLVIRVILLKKLNSSHWS